MEMLNDYIARLKLIKHRVKKKKRKHYFRDITQQFFGVNFEKRLIRPPNSCQQPDAGLQHHALTLFLEKLCTQCVAKVSIQVITYCRETETPKEESHSRDACKEELGKQLGAHCRRKSQGQCLETSSISIKSWVPILRQYDNVNFCYNSGVFSNFCRRKPSEVLTNIRETHDEFSDGESSGILSTAETVWNRSCWNRALQKQKYGQYCNFWNSL